jgi:hypothetical protein
MLKNIHENKSKFGQFFTTNYDYILTGLKLPTSGTVIEPFVGGGDLLKALVNFDGVIEKYDIDPKDDTVVRQDTLLNPPDLTSSFVLTNPPYLARNKNSDKVLFDKYDVNDLYKCFIKILIEQNPTEGILIIPVNFFCSSRANDVLLRKRFLTKYTVSRLNIFEEQVFDDTTTSVCSFHFYNIDQEVNETSINTFIFPSKKQIRLKFSNENNFVIGNEIFNLPQSSKFLVERATSKNVEDEFVTNILLKCIDDSINSKLCLSYVSDSVRDKYIDKTKNLSARSYATITIKPQITQGRMKMLVESFNEYVNTKRDEYNSLFLTNFRESNTIARKRISFTLAFEIINYLLRD